MNRKLSIAVLAVLILIAGRSFSAQKNNNKKNAAPQATQQAGFENVLIIGWDGAQRDHVKAMIGRDELPNLMTLSKEGKMVDIDITNGATDTKAGWAQILTGYSCEITGVFSNSIYQAIPEGYSLFERLEKHFGPDNIYTSMIVGKKGNIDAEDSEKVLYDKWMKRQNANKKITQAMPGKGEGVVKGGKVIEENGEKFVIAPAKPWNIASRHIDHFENGLTKNEVVLEKALAELEKCKDKRFCLFVHFADPDHSGHAHGENSQEYTDALKDDDVCTGKILDKLREYGIKDKTLVYITVDHGFNENTKGHSYAPYVFISTNDKAVNRDGDRMDIAATILKRMGVDLSAIEPKLSGTPLDEPAERKIAPAEKPTALNANKLNGAKAGEKSAGDETKQPAKTKTKKAKKQAA